MTLASNYTKIEPADFYYVLQDRGINVELICGKWFINKKEYELYGAGGIIDTLEPVDKWMRSNTNADAFVKYVIDRKSQVNGDWPDMPILAEAREKIKEGYVPESIAFSFTHKELMILHYLLEGEELGHQPYGIFFHGVGGSGKSTVCNIFASIFGDIDTSKCSFSDFGSAFRRETIAGKRLWYDGDITVYWSDKDANVFKKIITHDKDQFEKKCKNPYVAQYRCKALFCCNNPPRFDVSDSGVLRRIIYYNKNTKIENPDPKLANKVYTHEELLDIVCMALLTDISDFYEVFREETQQIIMSGNSVAKYGMIGDYESYVSKCYSANIHPFSKEKWESLRELFTQWQSSQSK